MDANTGLIMLAGALVLVTAYHAWTLRRALAVFQDMAAATREMAEAASRIYALSVVPRVECRTAVGDAESDPDGEARAGQVVSETTVANVGTYRVRLSRVRLESASEGEQVRRFVTRWLEPGDRETVRIPHGRASPTRVFVHLQDMAGQDHVIESTQP